MREHEPKPPRLFASYSHSDAEFVRPVIQAIRAAGVDVWFDVEELQPGENWQQSIKSALDNSDGFLVFVTPDYVSSAAATMEFSAVAAHGGLLIPVVLRDVSLSGLPQEIAKRQIIDLRGLNLTDPSLPELSRAADAIARATRSTRRDLATNAEDTQEVARALATSRRAIPDAEPGPPSSVFLVHGHDNSFLTDVSDFFSALGITTVVLKRAGGSSQSLLQKFLEFGSEARFAVVLLTGDDMGAARRQYDLGGVGERALQFRARQNVVLELGYFYGRLGWENVFVLRKPPDVPFPNFEIPSDLAGSVFDRYDNSGGWRDELMERLSAAGFEVGRQEHVRPPSLN